MILKNIANYSATLCPGVIDSLAEYERIEEIFNNLSLPPLEKSSPLETLKFLMVEDSLRQADLADIFGTQSVVSEILGGKREITKNQAKSPAQKFNLRLEAFI